MKLSDLHTGESAVVVKVLGHGAFRKRVMEMGFVKGRPVKAVLSAPLRDPVKYSLMGYEVSLRRSEADLIEVIPVDDAEKITTLGTHGASSADNDDPLVSAYEGTSHTINIALIGNPNCGKTSLFNVASGSTEHVGNYSGVTVECKTGHFDYKGYHFSIVDLPGTYSLSAYSPEELYVRRYLNTENPDVIVNVVDASNLERNLYLSTELIDMDHPMVIALNMYDELRASGDTLDYDALGRMIGVPVVPTVSRNGEGVHRLFDTIIEVYEGQNDVVRHVHVNLGQDVETAIKTMREMLRRESGLTRHFSTRYLAIKLLEGDSEVEHMIEHSDSYAEIIAERDRLKADLEHIHEEDLAARIANEKYGFISGALAETMEKGDKDSVDKTHIIDAFVTDKLFGFPIFIAVMLFIFWVTFALGQYPMDWIESGVDALGSLVNDNMSDGPLKDMIADGIIGGVGGVIVFLPNILILYFFISFMEDSGYMARAAFIMDRLMHKIGLHGKSFIPLVMGFGCNVPAIMASRTIESRSSRIITIMINPFMSCTARLPIYVLLIGTFFDAHAALVFFGLYALGVCVAMVTARLLRRFWFKADETPFVMELPPYRLPTLKSSFRHTWAKGQQYLRKMGGIILFASLIVWALNYFPNYDAEPVTPVAVADNDADTGAHAPVTDDSAIDPDHDSYLEMIGKGINPAMEPLGWHWRSTVAAVAAIPAKEITVSTLGVLYTGDEEASDNALSARITQVNPDTGTPDFNAANALSFMVFILLFCPCMATLVAITRETGSWRWSAFSAVYNTTVAYILAFVVYRIALLFI